MGSSHPVAEAGTVRWCSTCRAIYRADFARCPLDGEVLRVDEVDPMIGMTLGQHYVIDAFIGEGAMARVYRAHHALLAHKQFAVKVMIGDLAATLEMRLRFAQEADTASQLDHPNVVSVVDFGRSESGLMFMVMELVDGRSLADMIIAEGAIAPRRAMALARQICQGLAHAHERGLVHRDLKPDNIIISGKPELVRIVDFGLAVAVDDERSTRLTGVGLAMGTPIYAAPEQTHNEPVDHRADLFALGVTLYEMLSGRAPFEGNLIDIVRQNAMDTMPPILGRNGKRVAPAIEDVVRRLMRRDPAARFQDAASVLVALEAAQLAPSKAVSLAPPRSDEPAWVTQPFRPVHASDAVEPLPDELRASAAHSAPPARSRRVAKVLAAAAAVAGLAFGIFVMTSDRDAAPPSTAVVPAPAPAITAPAAVIVPPPPADPTPVVEAPVAAPPVEKTVGRVPVVPLRRVPRPAQLDASSHPVTTIAGAAQVPADAAVAPAADAAVAPVADEAFYGRPTAPAEAPPEKAEEPVAPAAPAPASDDAAL